LAFDVSPDNRVMMLVTRTARKLPDRFEIGTPVFIQYDLKEHRVIHTVPWAADPEPMYYFLSLRFSPDGKLLYTFSNEIAVYDATTLKQIDSFPIGPAPDRGDISFALAPDRKRAFIMIEEIGHHELWTVDITGRRL